MKTALSILLLSALILAAQTEFPNTSGSGIDTDSERFAFRRALETALFTDTVPGSGDGADGDFAVHTTSGAIYEKASGSWSSVAAPSSVTLHAVTSTPGSGFGDDGDLALVYSGGLVTELQEKQSGTWTSLATVLSTVPVSAELDTLSITDEFFGGSDIVSGKTGSIGDLNWQVDHPQGSGSVRVGTVSSATGVVFGVLRIATGTTTGDGSAIYFDGANNNSNRPFNGANFTGLTDGLLGFRFKVETGHTFYLGFMEPPSIAAAAGPDRFCGLFAESAETNFQFRNWDDPTDTQVDSGVAVDTGWHTFELRWDGSAWEMRLDGGSWNDVTANWSNGTCTIGVWALAESAASADLYLDKFTLSGTR